jgi:hypothetical protein
LLTIAGAAMAGNYNASGTGVAKASDEADLNEDGEGGSNSLMATKSSKGKSGKGKSGKGKGSKGKGKRSVTSISGNSDLLPWNTVDFCLIDPATGIPSGVVVEYFAASYIDTLKDGDQVFRVMDTSLPSTLCFNFVDDQSFTFEINTIVTGGTGKQADATGSVVMRGSGKTNVPGLSGFSVEMEGHID